MFYYFRNQEKLNGDYNEVLFYNCQVLINKVENSQQRQEFIGWYLNNLKKCFYYIKI